MGWDVGRWHHSKHPRRMKHNRRPAPRVHATYLQIFIAALALIILLIVVNR